MNERRRPARNIRLLVHRGLLLASLLALVGRLGRLQIVSGAYYQQAADVNRFRLEANPAPRGVVYDHRGNLLVRNLPQLSVAIIPAYLPEDPRERLSLLQRLAALLDVPLRGPLRELPPGARSRTQVEDSGRPLLEILEEAELAPYRPALVKSGVPRELVLQLEEEHLDWPGVSIQVEAVREYLQGSLTSHILGYMGPVPAEEAKAYEAEGYDPNSDRVGLVGVEYTYEKELRGQNGHKLIEVDVAGREVRTVGEPDPVVSGHSLRLTLDLALQTKVQEVLSRHLKELNKKQGVVVAMNPQTGEILALVSLPAYDNNQFTGGISPDDLRALQQNAARPLVDHAISGMFPPGSTFKLMVASGGLEEGVITADTRLHCGGILWLPNRYYPEDPSLAQPFYCFVYTEYGGQHGSLSLVSAIGQSCDIFFYQVGGGYRSYFQGLGEERLAQYAELFGLGARTGIDLPGETSGLVPSPKWKRVNYREVWTTGDTYNMSIGQGFVLATPLQMLNVAAAIANGGTLYRPQVVGDVLDADGSLIRAFSPDVLRTVPVSQANLGHVRQGMRAAVAGPGGTAQALASLKVAVAGKTGTAEFFADVNKDGLPDRDSEGNLPTHSWFVGFAPYDHPEIAIVAFVYGGGQGSAVSVPIAKEILTYYFDQERLEDQP